MIPILDLLNKIKWDYRENEKEYTVGFLDNISKEIISVKYPDIIYEEGNKFNFILQKGDEISEIPFHRIKEVRKNGIIIWQRTH